MPIFPYFMYWKFSYVEVLVVAKTPNVTYSHRLNEFSDTWNELKITNEKSIITIKVAQNVVLEIDLR